MFRYPLPGYILNLVWDTYSLVITFQHFYLHKIKYILLVSGGATCMVQSAYTNIIHVRSYVDVTVQVEIETSSTYHTWS